MESLIKSTGVDQGQQFEVRYRSRGEMKLLEYARTLAEASNLVNCWRDLDPSCPGFLIIDRFFKAPGTTIQ